MNKLVKSQYWTLAWIVAACLALMVLMLPRVPDLTFSLPLWLLVLAEWFLAFFVSFLFQFSSLRASLLNLRTAPPYLAIGLMLVVGAIAVVFNPLAHLDADGTVKIGFGQLIVMNLGIILLIAVIEQANRSDEYEESSKTSTLHRVTSTRLKRSGTNKTTQNKVTPFLLEPLKVKNQQFLFRL